MPAFDLPAALAALPDDERARAEARVATVHEAQRATYGMVPRDDSLLTFKWATGQVDETLANVCHELFVVHNIHVHTDYAALLEDVMRGVARYIRDQYGVSWQSTWQIVRAYAPSMLRLYCVHESSERERLFTAPASNSD